MSFFWFRRLYQVVRGHTSPIPEERAAQWKNRLSIGYAFLAWNAFGFVCYSVYKGKTDWAAHHGLKSPEELALSPGQQWAKTLGIKNAEVYRLSGFNLTKIGSKETNEIVEQSEDSG